MGAGVAIGRWDEGGLLRTPCEVTVGITTRDREVELKRTLEHLGSWSADVREVLVVDDGSATPIGGLQEFSSRFEIELRRLEAPRGYIVRRNELIRRCRTPLYLSLDDDSHPEGGSIEEAARELLGTPELLALSLRYTEGPDRLEHWPGTKSGYTQCFVGCAHLIRVDRFLELGGYLEELVHQHEEREFCLRAWKRGWRVRRSNALAIHHRKSPIGRDIERAAYWNARNDILVAFLHFPIAAMLKKVAWYLLRAPSVPAPERAGILRGLGAGALAAGRLIRLRRPLAWPDFNKYRALPYA